MRLLSNTTIFNTGIQAEKLKEQALPKKVPLPPSSVINYQLYDSKKRKAVSGQLEKTFNMGVREQMDSLVARTFFSVGLPFHLSRNPYFEEMIEFAANTHIPWYKSPGYNSLRTTLLARENANIDRLLAHCRSMWNENGVSIVSDRWSDY